MGSRRGPHFISLIRVMWGDFRRENRCSVRARLDSKTSMWSQLPGTSRHWAFLSCLSVKTSRMVDCRQQIRSSACHVGSARGTPNPVAVIESGFSGHLTLNCTAGQTNSCLTCVAGS